MTDKKPLPNRITEVSFQKHNNINASARITLTDELEDIGFDLQKDRHVRIKVVENSKKEKKIVIEKVEIK